MAKRRRRIATVAALLMTGAIVMQVGPACAMLGNFGLAAFDFSAALDENEQFAGLLSPCGRPNVMYVTEDGIPVTGIVYYTGDDMIFDCPVTNVVGIPPTGGAGGDTGGGDTGG